MCAAKAQATTLVRSANMQPILGDAIVAWLHSRLRNDALVSPPSTPWQLDISSVNKRLQFQVLELSTTGQSGAKSEFSSSRGCLVYRWGGHMSREAIRKVRPYNITWIFLELLAADEQQWRDIDLRAWSITQAPRILLHINGVAFHARILSSSIVTFHKPTKHL